MLEDKQKNKRKAIIFDLDGTLTDDRWRRAFSDGKEWEEYHRRSPEDHPNWGACALYNMMNSARDCPIMCVVTGRPARHQITTIRWMQQYLQHPPLFLIMRPEGEGHNLSSNILKARAAAQLLKTYNIIAAFDNCNADIEAYRSLGISTYKVELPH